VPALPRKTAALPLTIFARISSEMRCVSSAMQRTFSFFLGIYLISIPRSIAQWPGSTNAGTSRADRLSPLARTQGDQPDYLFSEHYDRKLPERRIHPPGRFARLGNMLSQLWRDDRFLALAHGPLLTTAHTLFGFPLNVVLRRSKKP
jgi:hypothetical protein